MQPLMNKMNLNQLERSIFLSHLGMFVGGSVVASSLFFADDSHAKIVYTPDTLLIIVMYAVLDLNLRDFRHEKTPFLLRWLRRSGLCLATSSIWGIMVGVAFHSPATTLLFTGILLYGISGFLSSLFVSWLWFPNIFLGRKRANAA